MERAIVIGCPGAGKSVFSRKLRDVSGLPLFYLDMIWHRPDKTNVPREAFDAALANQVKVIRIRPERRLLRVLRLILIAIPQWVLPLRLSPQSIAKCALSGCVAIASG